ncbi:MAG: 6,7-dimethyl-8-ribityllumazine synthase [Acidimicrobiales bacterium]
MAADIVSAGREEPELEGLGLRIVVVCGRFNDRITVRLLEGARRGLAAAGVADSDVTEAWVPGAFEIPLAAKTFASVGVDAVIGLGCVIRGDTAHFEHVAGQCAAGLQQAGLDTGVPCVFGVLTTEDVEQALVRSEGPDGHNVGEESARAAVEMARLVEAARRSS